MPGPSPAEAPSLSPAPHDLLFAALKGEVLLALSVAVTATVEHLVACLGHSAAELEPVLASLVAEGRVVTWEELVLAEGSTDAPTTLYGLPAQEDPPDTP